MSDSNKRSRLREFQAALADRLRKAVAAPQNTDNKLGILIGNQRWLVNLAEAGEIITMPSITSVPLTVNWFRGLVNLRGNLLSVVDLQQFWGQAATQVDKDSRLLAFNQRLQFNGAVIVSRMLGLRNILQMTLKEKTASVHPWVGMTYEDNEGENWTELRLEQLITDDNFLRVGKYLAV